MRLAPDIARRLAARVLACVLLLVAAAARPAPAGLPPLAEAPDAFGPFRMGMSMDEAVATAPGFEWYEARSQQTERVYSVTAADGWHLDVRNYDVTLQPGYYGGYVLEVAHLQRGGGADDCLEGMRALMGEFERRYGELEAPEYMRERRAPGQVSVQRSAEGYPLVVGTPGEVLREASPTMPVGRDSEAGVEPIGNDVPGATYWAAVRGSTRAQPWQVEAFGRYATRDGVPACQLTGRISRTGEVPTEVTLDVEHVPLADRPSIGLLHHSLDGVAALPAEGIAVEMKCDVPRTSGALRSCTPAGRAPRDEAVMKAVRWRLGAMRFDPRAIDERDPAPLVAHITVRLLPSDRIALGPPPAAMRAQREVRWVTRPTGSDLERAYPRRLLQLGAEARVQASCRIQDDGSVVCADARVTPAEDAEVVALFTQAGYEVLTKFHAGPLLTDGVTPSAGEWFTSSVLFRLGD